MFRLKYKIIMFRKKDGRKEKRKAERKDRRNGGRQS